MWFAVDRDGLIGYFNSSESGAVPVEALVDEPDAVYQRLTEILARGEAIHDLHGHLLTGPRQDVRRHRFDDSGCEYGAILFLKSLEPVRRQLAIGAAIAVPSSVGFAVTFRAS
jgi:hypothetical protein